MKNLVVFTVDVMNQSPQKAEEYLCKIKETLKKH